MTENKRERKRERERGGRERERERTVQGNICVNSFLQHPNAVKTG